MIWQEGGLRAWERRRPRRHVSNTSSLDENFKGRRS